MGKGIAPRGPAVGQLQDADLKGNSNLGEVKSRRTTVRAWNQVSGNEQSSERNSPGILHVIEEQLHPAELPEAMSYFGGPSMSNRMAGLGKGFRRCN
jgi:hypothetical protein